jgi:metal-sulfur cluster biosynthetic enzyme
MQGFFNGMSEEDKQKMKSYFEKMMATFPCCNMKDMSEEDKKAMMEKMKAFCESKMGMMPPAGCCTGYSK